MQFTIYGAGAIGGSLGAYLLQSGENVLFVDNNGEHVQEVNSRGLKIEGVRGHWIVKAKAIMPEEMRETLEVVLLAVRSQDTESVIRQLSPLLCPDSMVVSLQNGLNEESISRHIGKNRTIGASVNWTADYLGPGYIGNVGNGTLYIGELDGIITERIEKLQEYLAVCLPVQVTNNIWGYLWSKLIYGSIQFATALADLHIYDVVELPEVQPVLGDLVREAMQVSDALGIRLEPLNKFDPLLFRYHSDKEAMDKISAGVRSQLKTKTGVWRDISVRKRRTDVDWTVGVIVRKGEALGLSLPLSRRLIELIHEIEENKRSMDVRNFSLLMAKTPS